VPVKVREIFLLSPDIWDQDHTQYRPHSYHLCITLVHGRHADELRITQILNIYIKLALGLETKNLHPRARYMHNISQTILSYLSLHMGYIQL